LREQQPFGKLTDISAGYSTVPKLLFTVSDLSPIPLEAFDGFIFAYVLFGVVFVVDPRSSIPMVFFELSEKGLPDLFSSLIVQWIVADGHMYSRHESFVEVSNSICSEEYNSLKIVERTEENCISVSSV
jgi:hypothetical protein